MQREKQSASFMVRVLALAVGCVNGSGANGADWIVSQTLPDEGTVGFETFVAEVGKSTELLIKAGQDVRPFAHSLCGDSANTEYLKAVRKANPQIKGGVSQVDGTLRMPACVRYYRGRNVFISSPSTIEQELIKANGTVSAGVLARTYELNPWLKQSNGKIEAGRKLLLAAVVPPSSIELKPVFAAKSQEVTQKLAKFGSATGVASAEAADDVKLVTMVDPTQFDISAECAHTTSDWPYDREAVLQQLTGLRRAGRVSKERVLIVAADTGVPRNLAGIPSAFFYVNPDEVEDSIDNDDNTFVDDLIGTNVRESKGFPAYYSSMPGDGGSHGTSVSAESLGGPGFYMISENLETRLGVRVANVVTRRSQGVPNGIQEFFYIQPSDLVTAVRFAQAGGRPAILNFSVETPTSLNAFSNAISTESQLLVVAAAGNGGQDVGKKLVYPAALGGMKGGLAKRVISVAAHGPDGALLSFSNFGSLIDLAAPGCEVESIDASGARVRLAGTSVAAPLVTFAAGLLRSSGIASPYALKSRIVASVDIDPRLFDKVAAGGRLNIARALAFDRDVLSAINDKHFMSGTAEMPPTITSCGVTTSSQSVLKISGFKLPGNSTPQIRVLRKDAAGDLFVDMCTAGPLAISFRTGSGEQRMFNVLEGGDLTLRTL